MSYIATETLDILEECDCLHYRKGFVGITAEQLTRLSKLDLENLLPSDENGKKASCKILLKIAQAQIDGVLATTAVHNDQSPLVNLLPVVVQETAKSVPPPPPNKDHDDDGVKVVEEEGPNGVTIVKVVTKESDKNCPEAVVINEVPGNVESNGDSFMETGKVNENELRRQDQGDDDIDSVLFVDNLDPRVTKEQIHELFVRAGPIKKLSFLQGPNGQVHMGNCFIQFDQKTSVPIAIDLTKGTKLFDSEVKLQALTGSVHHHRVIQEEYCPWTATFVPAFQQNQLPNFIPLENMESTQQDDPSAAFTSDWSDPDHRPSENMWTMVDLTLGELGEPQPRQIPGLGYVTYIWDKNKKLWFLLS